MIDLTKFTKEELKAIEDLIDGKIRYLYKYRETLDRHHGSFVSRKKSDNKEEIGTLMVLKTKIINMKSIDKNKK